ncbi:MAG: aldo/keto reductase [Acidobacteria bacterium]|nr:MAG: aldo/keto reductase [Acidobacteriota bacterium]
MEYRQLGRSGLRVSALSFGAWVTFGDQIGDETAEACMKAAYDAGVNFFDNAEVYGHGVAEEMMGRIIRKLGWKRSDLVISTKIFWGGVGPNDKGVHAKHVKEGMDAALGRLGMDYVDLVFCHRPDFFTPVEETVRAMNQLIREGKAMYWGTSEWPADMIMDAWHIARANGMVPPLMEQSQYNLLRRERIEKEYIRLYDRIGLGTTIWSPLASGILTGKYSNGIPKGSRLSLSSYKWLKESIMDTPEGKVKIEKARKLQVVADELGISLARLALAWCLKNPHVSTVITGASRPEQVVENMKALDDVSLLTDDVMGRLETIVDNRPSPEPDFRGV